MRQPEAKQTVFLDKLLNYLLILYACFCFVLIFLSIRNIMCNFAHTYYYY